jgi:drug/metabolite transporter superfamily protein YnfA
LSDQDIMNTTHRRIFIFFTGVVPEILGGWAVSRWLKQHEVSPNPSKVYILGVEH